MLQTLPAELVAEVGGDFREVPWWFPGKLLHLDSVDLYTYMTT